MRNKQIDSKYTDIDFLIERILHDTKLIIHDLTTDDINELRNDLEWVYWKFKYTNRYKSVTNKNTKCDMRGVG